MMIHSIMGFYVKEKFSGSWKKFIGSMADDDLSHIVQSIPNSALKTGYFKDIGLRTHIALVDHYRTIKKGTRKDKVKSILNANKENEYPKSDLWDLGIYSNGVQDTEWQRYFVGSWPAFIGKGSKVDKRIFDRVLENVNNCDSISMKGTSPIFHAGNYLIRYGDILSMMNSSEYQFLKYITHEDIVGLNKGGDEPFLKLIEKMSIELLKTFPTNHDVYFNQEACDSIQSIITKYYLKKNHSHQSIEKAIQISRIKTEILA